MATFNTRVTIKLDILDMAKALQTAAAKNGDEFLDYLLGMAVQHIEERSGA